MLLIFLLLIFLLLIFLLLLLFLGIESSPYFFPSFAVGDASTSKSPSTYWIPAK
jgi:hypothetical protein